MALELHFWAALIFAGFILTDRLFLRRAFDQAALKPLYKKARPVLAIAALTLIVTGLWLLESRFYLKAALGLTTIALFFACPIASQKLAPKGRALYRAAVLALLVLTVITGRV